MQGRSCSQAKPICPVRLEKLECGALDMFLETQSIKGLWIIMLCHATFIKVHFLSAGEPNEGAVRFVWSSCSCIIHCILLRAGGSRLQSAAAPDAYIWTPARLPPVRWHVLRTTNDRWCLAGPHFVPIIPAPWRTWCLWFWHFRKSAWVGVSCQLAGHFILILTLPENLIWLTWLSDCKDVAVL